MPKNEEDSTHDDGPPPKRQKPVPITIVVSSDEESSDEEDPWDHDTDCDLHGECPSCCIIGECTTKDGRYLGDYDDGNGCGELCKFCDVPKGPHKMRDGVENDLTTIDKLRGKNKE